MKKWLDFLKQYEVYGFEENIKSCQKLFSSLYKWSFFTRIFAYSEVPQICTPPILEDFEVFSKVFIKTSIKITQPKKNYNLKLISSKSWRTVGLKYGQSPKRPLLKIEEQPYRCVICNNASARFSFARTYACHIKAFHSFYDGYDLRLPEPSARDMSFQRLKRKR